jgi:hypothetical protein
MIQLIDNQFHSNKTWDKPLEYDIPVSIQHLDWVDMFDQNGYRLTKLESHYAGANNHPTVNHRHEVSLRQDWFVDDKPLTGPHLNHAYLFERKGYEGEALEQLKKYAKENNLIYKLINYRGKWGIDFSMDYVGPQGNSMELLHFEYDSYSHEEIGEVKEITGEKLLTVDWEAAARYLILRKYEWINLEFFDQSKYKTDFFGLPQERFKMNAWQ